MRAVETQWALELKWVDYKGLWELEEGGRAFLYLDEGSGCMDKFVQTHESAHILCESYPHKADSK